MTTTEQSTRSETDPVPAGTMPPAPPPRRTRRRILAGLLTGAFFVGVAGIGTWFVASAGALSAGAQEGEQPQIATETVVRGDLEGSTTAAGTLRYGNSRGVQAGMSGTVTRLPNPGTTVSPGDRLYAIDDVPVFLLRGEVPAWRDFASGMADGPDVTQLEQALSELGWFADEPDEKFRWATVEAIMDWQESHGLNRTGELPFGSVVFAGGELRIGSVTASIGDQVGAGAELFLASGTTQIVDVDLSLSDQQLAVLDAPVVVRLPGGGETTGKIISVGTPSETEDATGRIQTVIPVVVALDDPDSASAFQEAAVTVDIPSERREDVLSVPVSALLAITPDQFGVEVVDGDGTTRQIPVETGLFTAGRVEISGPQVAEGMRVVVPTR